MSKKIPAPLIAAISDLVVAHETHAKINSLFMHAGASGDAPDETKFNKLNKCITWLQTSL